MAATAGSGNPVRITPQGELSPIRVSTYGDGVTVIRTIQGRYLGRSTWTRRLHVILTPIGNFGQTFHVEIQRDSLFVTSAEDVDALVKKIRLIIDELALLTKVPIERMSERTGITTHWAINDHAEAIAACLETIQLPEGATTKSDAKYLCVRRTPTCWFSITTLARLVEWHLAMYLDTPS